MLTLYRRHIRKCPHRAKGREHVKCSCPIWSDGELNGKRLRQSMKTRDWQRACQKKIGLEANETKPSKPIREEVETFLSANDDLNSGTKQRYRHVLGLLGSLADGQGIAYVSGVTVDLLDAFRKSRKLSPASWGKDLQMLRHFFNCCIDREWIGRNPAKVLEMPRNLKPAPREPYSPQEVARILAACDRIGRGSYERLGARGMILALRYTGLRISDVGTLEKNRIHDGVIYLYAAKNGKPVKLPVLPELEAGLEAVPLPRGAGAECRYFFWNGKESRIAMIRGASRTLGAVFRASGVAGAHAHRFRRTLATEILEAGGSIEEAADILGSTPAIIQKHYAKWSARRQERISNLIREVFRGTPAVHAENAAVVN